MTVALSTEGFIGDGFTLATEGFVIGMDTLVVSPTSLTVFVGGSEQLTVMETFAFGSTVDVTETVTWSTSNPDVISVVMGLVTGLASGSAVVRATLGPMAVEVTVTVPAFTLASEDHVAIGLGRLCQQFKP